MNEGDWTILCIDLAGGNLLLLNDMPDAVRGAALTDALTDWVHP